MKLKVRKELVAMRIKKVKKAKNGLKIQSCSYSLQEMLVQLKRLVVSFLWLDVFEEEEYRDKVMVQLSNWGPGAREVFFISSSCLFFLSGAQAELLLQIPEDGQGATVIAIGHAH